MKKMILMGFTIVAMAMTNMTFSASLANDSVMVVEPYVRAVPLGQTVSAAFMQLVNNSDVKRTIVSASSPVSKVAELHSHVQENGMMKMRRIENMEIPANETTVLQPGGLHIMLIGLHEQLKLNQKVLLTLTFADGSSKSIEAPVRKIMMHDVMKKHQ